MSKRQKKSGPGTCNPDKIELGTKRAVCVNYEQKQVYMMLEIYETVSVAYSQQIFNAFASTRSAPVTHPGAKARSIAQTGGSHMVEYFQGRFFVRASIA